MEWRELEIRGVDPDALAGLVFGVAAPELGHVAAAGPAVDPVDRALAGQFETPRKRAQLADLTVVGGDVLRPGWEASNRPTKTMSVGESVLDLREHRKFEDAEFVFGKSDVHFVAGV